MKHIILGLVLLTGLASCTQDDTPLCEPQDLLCISGYNGVFDVIPFNEAISPFDVTYNEAVSQPLGTGNGYNEFIADPGHINIPGDERWSIQDGGIWDYKLDDGYETLYLEFIEFQGDYTWLMIINDNGWEAIARVDITIDEAS